MPTSPECWALFGETIVGVSYRLLTDAYMAQHPDGDDSRQLQSVAVHLITLQAILREGQPLEAASRLTVQAIETGKAMGGFRKMRRPGEWPSTIADVSSRTVAADHYAQDVLSSWSPTEGDSISTWTQSTLESLYRRG